MKKKLLISSVVVILILSMSMAILVGCKPKAPEFGEQKLGATMPNIEGVEELDSSMSAFEMLQTGVENYYDADVAVASYNGSVATKVAGILVTQLVESTKVRIGKGDKTGANANGAQYFADNRSYSQFAKLYEKIRINPDGDDEGYVEHKIGEKVKHDDDKWSVGSWKDTNTYDTIANFEKATSSNPTILWMYDLKKDYVLEEESSAPVLDEKSGDFYTFTLVFDPEKSTVEYVKQMKVQLEVNAGMSVSGLTFEHLEIKVEMWKNGMFKRLYITESYKMKMAGIINSSITLYSDTQYGYEEVAGYTLKEHYDAF